MRVPTLLPPIQCTYGRGREKEGTGTANWILGHAIKTVIFRHRPFHSPKFCRGCSQHGGFAPEKDDNSQDFFFPFAVPFWNKIPKLAHQMLTRKQKRNEPSDASCNHTSFSFHVKHAENRQVIAGKRSQELSPAQGTMGVVGAAAFLPYVLGMASHTTSLLFSS